MADSDSSWMLYGANGYTGELIAEEAVRRGMKPVLAGRNGAALKALADKLSLPHRVFPLESPEQIQREISGVRAVLLAAGPFSATSAPVVKACIAAGIHYLDITGEIPIFESCQRRGAEAAARGTVLLPGVGFDVVPSDCLAASLKRALPEADHLELAWTSEAGSSRGTAKTMVEGLGMGGAIRENGRLRKVPPAYREREVPFRHRTLHAVSIPWGDVSTAFYSTGIPNIIVYMGMSPRGAKRMRLLRFFEPLLRRPAVQSFLKKRVNSAPPGPNEEMRRTKRSHLWGRVSVANGRAVEATLEAPEGYALTAVSAVECVHRLLTGSVPPGAHTPSTAFGPDLIQQLPGCDLKIS